MIRALFAAFAAVAASPLAAEEAPDMEDPHIWLEEVEGERALAWVREQNARSLAILEADPRFEPMRAEALGVLTSNARIPYGQIHAGQVYNFWQDETHVRGLWRRAPFESYRAGAPEWETLIDYDALAEAEGRNWIRGATVCLAPAYVHCMVELSDGGKDAAICREFNTETKAFVGDGFALPEAKSSVAWRDADTLIVGTDWSLLGADGGSDAWLTTSGDPREVRVWRRGDNPVEAPAFFSGARDDVSVFAAVEQSEGGPFVFVGRRPSFFETEYQLAREDSDFAPLPLPTNANPAGVLDGRLIVFLRDDWAHGGATYANGSVVALDLSDFTAELVVEPSATQSIEDVEVGETGIVVAYLENVVGRAARFERVKRPRRGAPRWRRRDIQLPDKGVVALASVGGGVDDALISFESLTTPDALYVVDKKNKAKKAFSLPPLYDAEGVVVEQRFATSADGTSVPYFIMARGDTLEKGGAPTVQYGYGGFLSAILPTYYADPGRPQHGALAGRMWIDRGGVLVLSNIRGGSEYGPRWHQAALKENRQRAFDDFIAISEHLIETGVTTPGKLGAVGRSNGGLLMGAVMTQRPDLYAAIDIGVPLFDMKRYNKLLAGASWMGEYGNPDIPAEWAYISQYSPYQKLAADAPYPKVLIYTSTKDDRVHPGHARKAAARLAELGHDFFYYENIEGGHGGTANQDQLAYRTALEYVYFARMLMGDANR